MINEIFNAANADDEYIEFLVTSDMTLQDLDSVWFGDSNTFSTGVASENSFNAAGIISNSSYFNSSNDVIAARTIITVGGSNISTDFNYNPDPANPSNNDSWNLTFTVGNGVDGVTGNTPFDLGSFGDSIWVSSSQPTAGAGYNDLISGVGYGWFAGPLGNAILTRQGLGEDGFQMLSPFSGDWDGVLTNGSSFSNQDPNGFDFANSEAPGGTMGAANEADNEAYAYDLRAVPEPSAFIPMILVLAAAGFFVIKKGQKETVAVS
ncbi:MAG: PEP-CTERM sorting domain-containing protein [Verrucomicrobiales bacterium]|nr:PEP-CTERM sorting domain-containing protein [Verrucomicrobiales bacterium]